MKLLLKEAIKKIKLTFGRFLSVFFIVALGVGFFAGIKNTSKDMLFTAASYYKEQNLMDMKLVSTLGFTDEDIDILNNIKGIEQVEGNYYLDALDSSDVVRVMGMPKIINNFKLIKGKLPSNNKEVLGDSLIYELGDEINLTTNDLKETKLKVVGIVESPMYTQFNAKGNTLLGNGKINSYIYTLNDNFKLDCYTVIYLTGTKTSKLEAYTNKYNNALEILEKNIKKQEDLLRNRRYDEIHDIANKKINDAITKVQREENKYLNEFNDAKKELDYNNKKLTKSAKQLNDKEVYLNNEVSNGKNKLEEAKEQLKEAKNQLENARNEYNKAKSDYDSIMNYIEIVKYISEYDNFPDPSTLPDFTTMTPDEIVDYIMTTGYDNVVDFLNYIDEGNLNLNINIDLNEITVDNYREKLQEIRNSINIDKYRAIIDQIDINSPYTIVDQIRNILNDTKEKLNQAQQDIDALEEELSEKETYLKEQEDLLVKKEQEGRKTVNAYKKQLNDGYKKLENAYQEYYDNYNLFKIKIDNAYQKISIEKDKLKGIEKPTIYTFNRKDNPGYSEYEDDTTRVNNIAKVFPVFFLLVAALVCLNTMSRMVEEDRGQMGIYKSLGFNNKQILFTYLLYASIASIFGSILGLSIGCNVLPRVIFNIYNFLYILPNIRYNNDILIMIITSIIMLSVMLLITIYTALSVLKETPASLLRPKAPAKGKKVLIENINFIWKRLNFSFKVTTRNIFRYKKRIFMTIIGIAGCTALTLTGFGLKNSIEGIVGKQFNEITKYDALIVLNDKYQELSNDIKDLFNDNYLKNYSLIYQESFSYKMKDKNNDLFVVVPENEEDLYKSLDMRNRKTKEKVRIDNSGVVITEKLANNLKIGKNDYIEIYNTNKEKFKFKVSNIMENYAYNYIYLNKDYYKQVFKKDVNYNMVLTQVDSNVKSDQISTNLLNSGKVINITFIKDMLKRFKDMVTSINRIVFVILLCSSLLAFIVLYNLTTINITERTREIATLKVLGFKDIEVSLYVYRETMILTVIGALFGLILGIFLHRFVMISAEMEFIMFQRNINSVSYIYAFLITLIFSVIISIFTHFKLKKIDMIEALKSVE